MKYVILTRDDGLKTALIFPNHIPHVNMCGDAVRQITHFSHGYPCPKIGEPTSAGFLSLSGLSGDIYCHGRSESLGLESDDHDIDVIRSELIRSEHSKDPLGKPPQRR